MLPINDHCCRWCCVGVSKYLPPSVFIKSSHSGCSRARQWPSLYDAEAVAFFCSCARERSFTGVRHDDCVLIPDVYIHLRMCIILYYIVPLDFTRRTVRKSYKLTRFDVSISSSTHREYNIMMSVRCIIVDNIIIGTQVKAIIMTDVKLYMACAKLFNDCSRRNYTHTYLLFVYRY